MKFPLFKQVALARDVAEDGLKKGDVATVVDYHPVPDGEDGYSLEVFNAVGDTIVVTVVAESAIFTEGERAQWEKIVALGHLPVFTG